MITEDCLHKSVVQRKKVIEIYENLTLCHDWRIRYTYIYIYIDLLNDNQCYSN